MTTKGIQMSPFDLVQYLIIALVQYWEGSRCSNIGLIGQLLHCHCTGALIQKPILHQRLAGGGV